MTKAVTALVTVVALASCGTGIDHPFPAELTVFAAASLEPAFDRIARKVDATTTFNFAGTQVLTAQLTQGAKADVFASADSAHMEAVQQAGLLVGSPQVFAHNKLEIAVEKGNPKGIHSLQDLARPGLVIVLADSSVPAGKYAQLALSKAGVTVHPVSLETQVTTVVTRVALGEADAGIVYVSDIVTSGKVDGVPIPDSQNVVADYFIGDVSDRPAAHTFIDYVLSPGGQAIMAAAGFEKV
ncbi:MAG TPA: molybdate ABC transporter substrate-binding protein [Candidatus Dormibacteraeota bacterium]|nr:molybdate ABC transporter substrate-binding protein [Candidatus Dormibacteraeota bacterium]